MTGSVVESKRDKQIGTWVHLELRIKLAASILDVIFPFSVTAHIAVLAKETSNPINVFMSLLF